jgi:hypothetical protein
LARGRVDTLAAVRQQRASDADEELPVMSTNRVMQSKVPA